MRIAFLTDTYWPRVNGVTVSTDIFLKHLRRLGHEVLLLAPDYGEAAPSHQDPPGVFRFRAKTVFFSPEDRLPDPRFRKGFYQRLDDFGPDLIHVQTEVASLFVREFARSRRVPVVQTCHTYFEQYIAYYFPAFPPAVSRAFARWLTRRLVKTAGTLVAPTLAMRDVVQSYGIRTPIEVIPTGIDEEDFPRHTEVPTAWAERTVVWKQRPVLLFVGRIAQEKNVDFLLEVLERVRRVVPEALLVMAGSGPYVEGFRKQVSARSLDEAVECLGYVHRRDLGHLYAAARVFTFPSVTETQGLVTIEAMMCGTPAVAIGKMGTREVMAGDNGGFMVDEDAEAFSSAVLRLLTDDALYQAKSDEALAYAQNWTAERMAQRIEDLYRRVLVESRVSKAS